MNEQEMFFLHAFGCVPDDLTLCIIGYCRWAAEMASN